jgi:cobalt transporter subunit CbtB
MNQALGGRAEGFLMIRFAVWTPGAVFAPSRFLPLAFAAALGAFVVGFAGFAPIEAVHNAAHDYRHAMGFPCH